MKNSSQQYKGDISLFVTIIVSAIMLILLLALSQKITIESRISRENLYSQQALQAANTGIDAWQYQWVKTGDIDITIPLNSIWPNINTDTTVETVITDSSGNDWIELSSIGVSSIQYRVEFQPENTSTGTPPLIIARGRVERGNTIIERTLQQEFKN